MPGVSRPLDERLLKLRQWAMQLVVERRRRRCLRETRAAIKANARRIKDAKPKGVLF